MAIRKETRSSKRGATRARAPAKKPEAVAAAADPASGVYNHVYDCVMVHFNRERPATPVNFVYPRLNIWRARADEIAACVKRLGTYYSHVTQAQLATATAAMHERSINGLIYGIYQLRRGA
jgi:hypothetical protein